MAPLWTSDIERITDRWYAHYSISRFVLILILVWFFVWGIYALSIWGIDSRSEQQVSEEFTDPFDNFMIFHGIGMILATIITPLFALHFLIDALESHSKDKGLIRAFLKVDTIRDGRRKLDSTRTETKIKGKSSKNSYQNQRDD